MKFQKLLLDHLYDELKKISIDDLFMGVYEQDVINQGDLFNFVECSYYLQVIEDRCDRDILGSFYELISSPEHKLTKVNLLYIICKVDSINKKSNSNLYI